MAVLMQGPIAIKHASILLSVRAPQSDGHELPDSSLGLDIYVGTWPSLMGLPGPEQAYIIIIIIVVVTSMPCIKCI